MHSGTHMAIFHILPGTHLYSWMERGTQGVQQLGQDHKSQWKIFGTTRIQPQWATKTSLYNVWYMQFQRSLPDRDYMIGLCDHLPTTMVTLRMLSQSHLIPARYRHLHVLFRTSHPPIVRVIDPRAPNWHIGNVHQTWPGDTSLPIEPTNSPRIGASCKTKIPHVTGYLISIL